MSGKEAIPLGRICLSITFGQPNNFRKEPLTFEVVDLPAVYHTLLGRPCFAKFMAVPNYIYLKLKMPNPKGVMTIKGSFEKAYYCEQDCVAQAATLVTPCDPNGFGRDVGRVPAEEATKTVATLDRLSIGEVDKDPSISGGSAGPSI